MVSYGVLFCSVLLLFGTFEKLNTLELLQSKKSEFRNMRVFKVHQQIGQNRNCKLKEYIF